MTVSPRSTRQYKSLQCFDVVVELKEELQPPNAVGLVVEYAPATGETRVRFPDGVPVHFFVKSGGLTPSMTTAGVSTH
jgi:hypothetical protein